MRHLAKALLCAPFVILCLGSSCPSAQDLCALECFADCSTNGCAPTCDAERSTCYSTCESNYPDDATAENSCRNDCAAQRNTCMDDCEDTCTDECNGTDATDACADGEWDDWWGGIGG